MTSSVTSSSAPSQDSDIPALIEGHAGQSPLAVSVRGLQRRYGSRVVIDALDLDIHEGESSRSWVKADVERPRCCAHWPGSIGLIPGGSAHPCALPSCSRSLACCLGQRCPRTSRSVMKPRSAGPVRRELWPKSGCPAARRTGRATCRAVRRNASRWRGLSFLNPRSCCWTNRSRHSTRSRGSRCTDSSRNWLPAITRRAARDTRCGRGAHARRQDSRHALGAHCCLLPTQKPYAAGTAVHTARRARRSVPLSAFCMTPRT